MGDVNSNSKKNKPEVVATIIQQSKPKTRPERQQKRPEPKKMMRTAVKAGPRFAMNLDVVGTSGVAVNINLTSKGDGSSSSSGDVDVLPSPVGNFNFKVPLEVKQKELDASVLLGFCVDPSGKVYDIRVVEEKPSGLGMADAARAALSESRFSPAQTKGRPVSFCGLEQPFEVRFDD